METREQFMSNKKPVGTETDWVAELKEDLDRLAEMVGVKFIVDTNKTKYYERNYQRQTGE